MSGLGGVTGGGGMRYPRRCLPAAVTGTASQTPASGSTMSMPVLVQHRPALRAVAPLPRPRVCNPLEQPLGYTLSKLLTTATSSSSTSSTAPTNLHKHKPTRPPLRLPPLAQNKLFPLTVAVLPVRGLSLSCYSSRSSVHRTRPTAGQSAQVVRLRRSPASSSKRMTSLPLRMLDLNSPVVEEGSDEEKARQLCKAYAGRERVG